MPALIAASGNSPMVPEIQQDRSSKESYVRRLSTQHTQPSQQKSAPRRSSKPIINWFQRKLAGTVRAKRAEPVQSRNAAIPLKVTNRVTSSPLPSAGPVSARQQGRMESLVARRKTISLNGDDDGRRYSLNSNEDEETSIDNSSMARESTWSPASALEADEDASLRPIPPSGPPSPSPSRSSSSYLSDPRTFKSIAASTKPTTLLSIDLNGNGMAHIAQAPLTPSQISRFPVHVRSSSTATNPNLLSSGASTTFSALPPSPHSSRPSSIQSPSSPINHPGNIIPSVQAPLHTAHHPRNNPRPSSPPLDNASVLTLASSAFAMPGLRTPGWPSAPPSAFGASDSISHFDGSAIYADAESSSQLGEDDRVDEGDASLRALRPRSSRRGSWESEASRWSARIQTGSGTPLTRERSVWTSNSNNVEIEDSEAVESTATDNTEHSVLEPLDTSLSPTATTEGEPTPRNPSTFNEPEPNRCRTVEDKDELVNREGQL